MVLKLHKANNKMNYTKAEYKLLCDKILLDPKVDGFGMTPAEQRDWKATIPQRLLNVVGAVKQVMRRKVKPAWFLEHFHALLEEKEGEQVGAATGGGGGEQSGAASAAGEPAPLKAVKKEIVVKQERVDDFTPPKQPPKTKTSQQPKVEVKKEPGQEGLGKEVHVGQYIVGYCTEHKTAWRKPAQSIETSTGGKRKSVESSKELAQMLYAKIDAKASDPVTALFQDGFEAPVVDLTIEEWQNSKETDASADKALYKGTHCITHHTIKVDFFTKQKQ